MSGVVKVSNDRVPTVQTRCQSEPSRFGFANGDRTAGGEETRQRIEEASTACAGCPAATDCLLCVKAPGEFWGVRSVVDVLQPGARVDRARKRPHSRADAAATSWRLDFGALLLAGASALPCAADHPSKRRERQ